MSLPLILVFVSVILLIAQFSLMIKRKDLGQLKYYKYSLIVHVLWVFYSLVQLIHSIALHQTGYIVLWSILTVINFINIPLVLSCIKLRKQNEETVRKIIELLNKRKNLNV